MGAALETDETIYKVDTVPPPEGEDDAYGAETKVGALARAAIDAMLAEADRKESERLSSTVPPASSVREVRPVAKPEAPAIPKAPRVPSASITPLRSGVIPKIGGYDEDDDDSLFEGTLLNESKTPPPPLPANTKPVFKSEPPMTASAPPAQSRTATPIPPPIATPVLVLPIVTTPQVNPFPVFVGMPGKKPESVLTKSMLAGIAAAVVVASGLVYALFT